MEAHPPAVDPGPAAANTELLAAEGAPVPPRPEGVRDLIPWVTEIAFVTGVLVLAVIVFLVLTSGQNPFATALIPVILVLAAVAAVLRHRSVRRHRADASYVHSRHSNRERRGF